MIDWLPFSFIQSWYINFTAISTASSSDVFTSARGLLMILYESDSRRNYAPKDHWLIKYVYSCNFFLRLKNHSNFYTPTTKCGEDIMDSLCHVCPSPLSCPLYKSYTNWRIFFKLGSDVHLNKRMCRTHVSAQGQGHNWRSNIKQSNIWQYVVSAL
jgi:hypothetical protein